MTLRIVQWTTGNVGKQSVAAISRNPGLELVGCYAWSPDKVGRDVGELCGLDPLGVNATDDVDALLALAPDCVVYNPMWPSIDELVRILAAGVNVVTTAAFINGRRLGPDRKRLADACERGGTSLFGTGVNPGFAELLGIVVAGVCERIDKVTISEQAHTGLYDSPATEMPAGFGRPIDDPNLQAMTAAARRCSAKRWRWWPMRSESSSTTWSARQSTPRRRRSSISVPGRSQPGAWLASRAAGRVASAAGPWSS